MKKTVISSVSLVLALVFMLFAVSCGNKVEETGIWEGATYLKDTTVGEGSKEVKLDIEAEDQKITLTVKTDKATLGEALYELGLINDASFFDTLNGMKADWDKNQVYWAFYKGEEYMMVGVGDTEISGGEHYRFVVEKG